MLYVVICTDKSGKLSDREGVRPSHRKYLRKKHKVTVLKAGPTLDSAGKMNGTVLLVRADEQELVEELIENDPYSQAGIFKHVDIRPCNMVDIKSNDLLES